MEANTDTRNTQIETTTLQDEKPVGGQRPLEPVVRRQHELKCWPGFFGEILSENKNFEIRCNDRDYRVGDLLRLMEYDPETKQYTGREVTREITFMTDFAQQPGYVVMSLKQTIILEEIEFEIRKAFNSARDLDIRYINLPFLYDDAEHYMREKNPMKRLKDVAA